MPILTDWCDSTKIGETTRYSGLLALGIIQQTETEENFYIHGDAEEKILKVVFNAAHEIQSELKGIFDKVLTNKWTYHKDPYKGLCSKILSKPYIALEVIKTLPLSVIQLCDLYWQKREKVDDGFGYGRDSMESRYGLADEHKHDYSPASAHQTPSFWLLQNSFKETLDFIINFTNRAVENYRQSDYGKKDVEEIILYVNEIEVKQYSCWAFWGMYRGIGSPVVPYMLQSIHMALEKILLDFSQISKPEIIELILLRILVQSRSTSLTAVVCSVVLANPEKFYATALILFKTIELFNLDTVRCSSEFQAKSTISIGYGLNPLKDTLYTDERLKTCDDEHRSSNLESLIFNYQYFGVKGFTEEQNSEFIDNIYEIIDQHKSKISTDSKSEEKSWGILLARMDRRNLTPKITEQDDNKLLIEFSPIKLSDELRNQSEQANKQFEETFKYSFLRSWSDFLIGGKKQNKNQKLEEYDKDPLLALSETKQLVEELKSGRNAMGKLDYSIPAFVCSKLMIEHENKLSQQNKNYCKEIILSSLSGVFSDDYGYQISDGVEASFHAIPLLIKEFPVEKEDYISLMLLALFDETSIGNYKRVCDYVIESIHESNLWEQNPNEAQAILLGYIKIKPIYKKIITEKRKEKGYGRRISKSLILKELDKKTSNFNFTEVSFDIKDISLFDIRDLEIIYQLIPSKTKDKVHLAIYKNTLPLLASQLLRDQRSYKKDSGDDSHIYLLRRYIFKRFASFILHRETSEIEIYLEPFIDSFESTEETASFIGELISAENNLIKYDQFWYVWNSLYPKIIEICKNPRSYHLKEVIINYLLAWRWWSDGIESWHSLKNNSLSLYTNASKDIGHIPSVLYSITRVLNSIGKEFKTEGIDWIYTIVSNNRLLELGDLESHTLSYLENFMRKFIFINKQKLKEEVRLKNKVIPILDFMIERGSIHGYLLRENIL